MLYSQPDKASAPVGPLVRGEVVVVVGETTAADKTTPWTQLPDGSWHVASRAPKFQPYFQSGFPHDHDQWISSAATSWGAIALSYAVADGPARVALK